MQLYEITKTAIDKLAQAVSIGLHFTVCYGHLTPMSDNIFEIDLTPPQTPPKPLELAIYANQKWLWLECPIEKLSTLWAKWAERDSGLIEWYRSLSSDKRRLYTPIFEQDLGQTHGGLLWSGWFHTGWSISYMVLPRKDPRISQARSISTARFAGDNFELVDEEFPYLDGSEARNDPWFLIAFAAAWGSGPTSDPAHRKWVKGLAENPKQAVQWFTSLQEDERQRVSKAILQISPFTNEREAFYKYERGKLHIWNPKLLEPELSCRNDEYPAFKLEELAWRSWGPQCTAPVLDGDGVRRMASQLSKKR